MRRPLLRLSRRAQVPNRYHTCVITPCQPLTVGAESNGVDAAWAAAELVDGAPGRDIPQRHRLINQICGGEPSPVRAKGRGPDAVDATLQRPLLAVGRDLPQLALPFAPARHKPSAVGAEGGGIILI